MRLARNLMLSLVLAAAVASVPHASFGNETRPGAAAIGGGNSEYSVVVDDHDTPPPTDGQYLNYTGGDRGVLNASDVAYTQDGDSAYAATVVNNPGSWTWGGMWYSLLRVDQDNLPLDFGAIFGPYVKPEYQGKITAVELAVDSLTSPSHNIGLQLTIELKDETEALVGTRTWTDLASLSYPAVFTWTLTEEHQRPWKIVAWKLDSAQVEDSISVDHIGLKALLPDSTAVPTERQAFLWTYSWLMANYNPETGMVEDRSSFVSQDRENVSATAKAAKIIYYAYKMGYTIHADAEAVITKIADTLINTVPRGPSAKNSLWPHFTQQGGAEPHADSEWASGDTAFAALDIIAALQMLGDPQGQIPALDQFLDEIDWNALLTMDGFISHGYDSTGELSPWAWSGFGMETIGVNWAYASATGSVGEMEPPPSDNGSGFIDNAQYPLVLSGMDSWGNDWDAYRDSMADIQIGWYTAHPNPYLSAAGLFGLSAAEGPEIHPAQYVAYGVGGAHELLEDGDGEVIVPHYAGMIADIRLEDAKRVWEGLRDQGASFLEGTVTISPLNNVESLRVNKTTGACTTNHLKGSWNLALQAEGWALADPVLRAELVFAVRENAFLREGYALLKPLADFVATPTAGASPLPISFTDQSAGSPTSWLWAFGDGAVSTEQDPTHEYASPGFYTVALTASGDQIRDTEAKRHYVAVGFSDITPTFWAFYQIIACYEAGIVQGYDGGSYEPSLSVTRDQMAVYISRALAGGDVYVPTGPATASFSDVPTDYWAFRCIEYAHGQGIVQGYGDGTYGPTTPIDRGQMAAFIARALAGGEDSVPAGPATPQFPDVATDFWAYKHIEYIADPARAVTQGYSDGWYHPEYICTRDQMAVFVQRAFGLWIPPGA